jgi:hypothetical protein
MAKILLLDFSEEGCRRLLGRKYDVEAKQTNWKSGRVESLAPASDCRIIFYQVDLGDFGTGLHATDVGQFEQLIKQGGAIICFVGDCKEYHLNGLIGNIPNLKFQENKLPDKISEAKDTPYATIFSEFRPFISQATELFPMHNNLGKTINLKEGDPPQEAELQVLAESFRNYPISALLRRGKGFYVLLPWFGEKNIDVAEFLLAEILPQTAPYLFESDGKAWLDSYDYIFPGLLGVYKQMEEENDRHRQSMLRLEQKIDEIKSAEQDPFNKLLTAQGAELQQAVAGSLKYLNWPQVINVNEYWKHVIRIKEEDIWLMDENDRSVEQLIRGSQVTLVMVRSGKGATADEDCLLLQRYKGRRMQEFDNTKMKAILIGNYFSEMEAKLRKIPFSETQISEAAKDGNGLLTTYELFKAIKAEKEGKTNKDAIREQLKNKAGLITFDY